MIHGGQLKEAKLQFPHVTLDWIDLSTGINPYAYPFSSISSECLTQLPSIKDEDSLKECAALRYGIKDTELIAAAPGTQILISLLPYIFNVKQVCVLYPTYMEHINTWKQVGIPLYQVNSIDEFMRYSEQEKTIGIICNPNNPDGRLLPVKQMQEMVCRWSKFNNHIIVDEAFMDLEGQTIAPFLPYPGLTVLRSFGKTYGLAGVRLGFLLSNPIITKKIRQMLGLWSISGQAIHIGLQALQNQEWILNTKNKLATQIQQFDELFIQNGCNVIGGTHLFRLIEFEKAPILWKFLANHGIWVRRFNYNATWLRFGLSHEEHWQRVAKTIQFFFKRYY